MREDPCTVAQQFALTNCLHRTELFLRTWPFFSYKRNPPDSSLPCSQEADKSNPQLTALCLCDELPSSSSL